MGEIRKILVENLAGRERADKYLAEVLPELSRSAIQRVFDAGEVSRNGIPLAKNARVEEGDALEFRMPETGSEELGPVSIPLEILFEDQHLVAVNKASGMIVHPGAGTEDDTLVHALLAHCDGKLSRIGGDDRPGIVHRLDRETSGVILAAKTDQAHAALAGIFANREIEREYLAIVAGAPELLSGSIRAPIGRHPVHRYKMSVVDEGEGREARTDWEKIEGYGKAYSLLRCKIFTGRTHQIRVHLSSEGHPVLGDRVYGFRTDPRLVKPPPRVMLHAIRLRFRHPITNEALEVTAPIPDDFREQAEQLRKIFRAP